MNDAFQNLPLSARDLLLGAFLGDGARGTPTANTVGLAGEAFDGNGRHPHRLPIDLSLANQRDLTVASAAGGGYLVDSLTLGNFVAQAVAQSVALRFGAQRALGLRANLAIPKQTTAATTTWAGSEATQGAESTPNFGQVVLTPKSAITYLEVSKQLLTQGGPLAELIVRGMLARAIGTAIDTAIFQGSGASGQPAGIFTTAGIGAITGTAFNILQAAAAQATLASANALTNSCAWVGGVGTAQLLQARISNGSNAFLWSGSQSDGRMAGYPAVGTTLLPSAALALVDFSSVLLAGWGAIEVESNPFANFPAGIVGFRVIASVDVAALNPAAIAYTGTVS